ncbi:restriction endonuclease-related protein [Crossiella cryophila]|uniref:Putative RNA-binding Zn-ribbon protein involved in translation (DUF1610 family) n=1 Tax=Crossiella cryophila TaxID=43355 RepID=A0A7W7CAE8_9PSEU|nr:hypothetical protein [Crossiella cryophila]MBB4677445.1 putative RNA-binding Zn-ribbon protein involved in translation (DUF1610 family) [Crossiella cryophila]
MAEFLDGTVPLNRSPVNQRRDQAITACCLAAAVLGDPDLRGDRQGRVLMSCLGVLAATHPVGRAPSMSHFRSGLRGPLGDLLPADVDTHGIAELRLLDVRGQFADEAEDLCREFLVPSAALEEHWPWDRVAAEQEERRIYEVLRRLPEEEYTRLRAHLVEQPVGDLRTLRRVWDALLPQFYEPVAEWPWRQVHGWFFECPACGWPMRVIGGGRIVDVRCEAHARHGVSYTCEVNARSDGAPVLRPAGKRAEPVAAKPATKESLAVSRVVWRYVTLPGLLECALRDHALKLGADVVMWPHRDRYDLAITLGRQVWRVDAKAWASPVALGEALRGTPPVAPGLVIVVPNHQRPSLDLLRHVVGDSGYRVMTAKEFTSELAEAAAVTA